MGSSFSVINTGDIDVNQQPHCGFFSARKEPMANFNILTRSIMKATPFLPRTQCGCALVT